MIILRPRIAGQPVVAAAGDGLPLPGGSVIPICWDCFGPAVTWEWYYRETDPSGSGVVQLAALEYIWDKGPCRPNRAGAAHAELTVVQSTESAWTLLLRANPSRYAIHFGAIVAATAPPQGTVVVR